MTEKERKQDQQENEEAFALMLYDNSSSEITGVLPKNLLEPAIIISKILGFENVDAYAIELIRRDIESYQKGGDTIEEEFQEYLRQFINDKNGTVVENN